VKVDWILVPPYYSICDATGRHGESICTLQWLWQTSPINVRHTFPFEPTSGSGIILTEMLCCLPLMGQVETHQPHQLGNCEGQPALTTSASVSRVPGRGWGEHLWEVGEGAPQGPAAPAPGDSMTPSLALVMLTVQ